MNSKIIALLIASILVTSCDFFTGLEGKVIDEKSKIPIVNANVSFLDGKNVTRTNDDGYFNVRCRTGLRLIEPEIKITKDGYKPFQIKIKRSKEKVTYFVKSETFFWTYETFMLQKHKRL